MLSKYLSEKSMKHFAISLIYYARCRCIGKRQTYTHNTYAYKLNLQCSTENEMDSDGKHLLSYFILFPMVVLLLGISNIVFNEMTFSMKCTAEHIITQINAYATYVY